MSKEKFFKSLNGLSLPLTLILISLILGGFYYATQTAKQGSIERQQRIEQEAKKMENDKEYVSLKLEMPEKFIDIMGLKNRYNKHLPFNSRIKPYGPRK